MGELKEHQTPMTIDEQVENLKSIGVIVDDEEYAKKILNDISFTLRKGEKAALVGINGAGKTTIVKLICGFYHPTEGHIYVNGTDISELDLYVYYDNIAAVFQDAFSFSFTIAENVTCLSEGKYDEEKCFITYSEGVFISTLYIDENGKLTLKRYDGTLFGKLLNIGNNVHTIQEVDFTLLFDEAESELGI